MKLSVIIPSCKEQWLQITIDDILNKAKGEIEVIAYLDGYWPDPPIKDDSRVVLIHSSIKRGMRTAINSCARISSGEYLMKCDAHCIFGEGFDEILKADCEDNWLVVPRRYNIDDEKWERGNKITDYMYLSRPERRPPDNPHFWEHGFHGILWKEKNRDEELKKKEIDDLMSFQGSCWFMPKKLYDDIGGMEIGTYGYFAQEAQELGNKVWLSGGRVIRNKKTWYAHLHKGKKYGRGYFLSSREIQKSAEATLDIWMNNKWEKQIHDMKWLIDKFSPVPGWENFDWTEKW